MCGGEIVDEKWKFSFQGALTGTVEHANSRLGIDLRSNFMRADSVWARDASPSGGDVS
eukprot:COSAG02_NODE_254_length_26937_cov_16.503950_24_plen_58_part_00